MSKTINYDFLNCIKKMPPLSHKVSGEDFDIRKSRVVWWIIKQPDVLQKLFDIAHNRNLIRYDKKTGKWVGVEFEADD